AEKKAKRSGASAMAQASTTRPKATRHTATVDVDCGANQNRRQVAMIDLTAAGPERVLASTTRRSKHAPPRRLVPPAIQEVAGGGLASRRPLVGAHDRRWPLDAPRNARPTRGPGREQLPARNPASAFANGGRGRSQ